MKTHDELRELELKLKAASELVFEVEHAFDDHATRGEQEESIKTWMNRYGYQVRIKIGDLDHQLKVLRGIRK
jgi:hypothetical protein